MDFDIRQLTELGFDSYGAATFSSELSDAFWDSLLPPELNTSNAGSPYFQVFQAAQIKLNDKGFLSRDITVQDLILNRCDVHHVFPREYLKSHRLNRGRYNQIANYVLAQSEINIAIGKKAPSVYFQELGDQCQGGPRKYGGITDPEELKTNLRMHCLLEALLDGKGLDYDGFLHQRRQLMTAKREKYFLSL